MFPQHPDWFWVLRSVLYMQWADTENCWGKVLSAPEVEVTRLIVGATDIGV